MVRKGVIVLKYEVIFVKKNGEEYRVVIEGAENEYTACMGATSLLLLKLGRKSRQIEKIVDVQKID